MARFVLAVTEHEAIVEGLRQSSYC